jgi:hypothetical protein
MMAWTREQATATIGHAHHMQSSFIPARLEWATIGCMGVRSPIAFFAAPKQGGRRTRKHDVGWETTRLGQKKDFISPDTYFFLFLLYSNICINEFYKLRWEKDPLCPPRPHPGSARPPKQASTCANNHRVVGACGVSLKFFCF